MKKLLFSLLLGLSLSGLSEQGYAQAESPSSVVQEEQTDEEEGEFLYTEPLTDEQITEANTQMQAKIDSVHNQQIAGSGEAQENSQGGGKDLDETVAEESDGDKSSMCFVDPVNAVICVVGVIVFTVVVGCAISDAAYYVMNDEGDMVCLNYVESW